MTDLDRLLAIAKDRGLTVTGHGVNAVALAGTPAKVPATVLDAWTEAEFTDAVGHLLAGNGWKAIHLRPAWTEKAGKKRMVTAVQGDGVGFPDWFAVRGARRIALELKVPPNKPTASQTAWLSALAVAGFETGVYYPEQWDELVTLLK